MSMFIINTSVFIIRVFILRGLFDDTSCYSLYFNVCIRLSKVNTNPLNDFVLTQHKNLFMNIWLSSGPNRNFVTVIAI